ncbi:MAG: MFS transporter [Candidatus Latescibacteria bacterium]|nr:MFS transporter [Candidatus Latescibacterota bacterium]
MTTSSDRSAPIRHSRLVNASPVYYGWIILLTATVAMILTGPGQTYAISVFIDHFIVDLGISRSLVSTLYTVGTLTASFALPYIGRQVDRRGSRLMMAAVTVGLGLACVYMGFVHSAWMLLLGFLVLRMLGQGSLGMVSKIAINQWWMRRRGMAMGIAGMATALLSQGGFPNLLNWLIPLYGWRTTYMLLGAGLLLGLLPLVLLLIRDRPEEYGLTPDGTAAGAVAGEETVAAPVEHNWTASQVTRTFTFWVIIAGLCSMSALNTGLTFHIFSIFNDNGLSSAVAAAVFIPMSVTAAVVQLGGGLLIDRIPVRILLSLSLVLQAVVLVMSPYLVSVEIALLYGVLSGIRHGLQQIAGNVIWAKYYGRLHLGSITGIASTAQVASSALGPMPFGIARDLLGSYTAILVGGALLPFVLGVVILRYAKTPQASAP